jgi:segregation and condensation protein B
MADTQNLRLNRPIPGEWQLEAEPVFEEVPESAPVPTRQIPTGEPAPVPAPVPIPEKTSAKSEQPPSALQILEAMLFVGGSPLTVAKVCSAIRGLTAEQFRELAEELARKYRRQRRPYSVVSRDDGFVLAVKPAFRSVREKLSGGPREARLSQPVLDALSLIAYSQPLAKTEVDAMRGQDSAGVIRQLVRLGLIAVVHRADSDQKLVRYGTTPRFLELFSLASLEDLPRMADMN